MKVITGTFINNSEYWCELATWVSPIRGKIQEIKWEFYICAPPDGDAYTTSHKCSWQVIIDGDPVERGYSTDYDFRFQKRILVASGDTPVIHDGTNVECRLVWSGDDTGLGSATASGQLWVPEGGVLAFPPSKVEATRKSDNRIDLTWQAQWIVPGFVRAEQYEIWRRDCVDNEWGRIGTGVSTRYSDISVVADRQYWYRVQARRGSDLTPGEPDNIPVWTTPATPPRPTARIEGSDVWLEWAVTAKCPLVGWEIEKTHGSDTETMTVAPQVGKMRVKVDTVGSDWEDYSYRVRALAGVDQEDIKITSAWSPRTTEVEKFSTANPPVLVEPLDGAYVAQGSTVRFKWTHQPTDATAQTKARLIIRRGQNEFIKTGDITGNVQQFDWVADRLGGFVWYVQTAGGNNTLSKASTPWTFTVTTAPTVTITTPTQGEVIDKVPTITWTLDTTAEGGQQFAHVFLTTLDNVPLAQEFITGSQQSWTPTGVKFTSGSSYKILVDVFDANGVEARATVTFTIEFEPPEAPDVTYMFDSTTGIVQADITGGMPEGDVELWGNYGDGWVKIVDATTYNPDGVTLTDPAGSLTATYRVRAIAPTSAFTNTPEHTPTPDSGETPGVWFYLNAGSSLQTMVRWRGRPTSTHQFDQQKTLFHFSGREWPVEYTGVMKTRTINIGGILEGNQANSHPRLLRDVIEANTPTLYRDPAGRRLWVSLSAVSFDDQPWVSAGGKFWSFTATITQVEAP